MNIENPKEKESSVSKNTKPDARRTFLKRASAGAVLTSLPVHSVWGAVCTVSGAMSGNMSGIQRHKDCETPVLPIGRSADIWRKLMLLNLDALDGTTNDGANGNPGKLHEMFSSVENFKNLVRGPNSTRDPFTPTQIANRTAKNVKRLCLLKEIQAVGNASSMQIDSALVDASFEVNVLAALSNGSGVDYNAAAVWLNVYFNFGNFGSEESIATANAVVEQLISYLKVQVDNGFALPSEDVLYNFKDDSTTSYLPTTC